MQSTATRLMTLLRAQAGSKRSLKTLALTTWSLASTLKAMDVRLTPDQEAFIRQVVASGRYRTAEDAVRDAMERWEEAERVRIETAAAIDTAEADLAAGGYSDWTDETLPQLVEELKRDARLSQGCHQR